MYPARPSARLAPSCRSRAVTDPVFDVNVRLVQLSHGVPRQIDLGLVHPRGPSLLLLSGVGTATPAQNATLTMSDEGSDRLLFFDNVQTGEYRPTNVSTGDDPFPAPAPAIPTEEQLPSLSIFDGLDPNGAWSLYGRDTEAIGPVFGDSGRMTDWCVDLETTNPLIVAGEAAPAAATSALTVSPNPAVRIASVRLVPSADGAVSVALFDVTGRRVAVLYEGSASAGAALVLPVDVSRLPVGVYVVRAVGTGAALAQRLTVVR